MTAREALALVKRHGVMLEAARGPVPSLVDAVVRTPVRGSWWAHPQGREVFALTRALRASPDILVCRLVEDRITYVHRHVWPALARLAEAVPPGRLARLVERHTPSGRHVTDEVAFPGWVPAETLAAAALISEARARSLLGDALRGDLVTRRRARGPSRRTRPRRSSAR